MPDDYFYERSRFTEKPLRPYVIVVGQVALAWNHLHEYLGRFFGMLSGSGTRSPLIATWQSQQVDRAKRAMMSAAFQALPDDTPRRKKMRAEVKWILDRVQALEDTRNDAIHAPLHLSVSLERVATEVGPKAKNRDFVRLSRVKAMEIGDNFRAKKLSGKDVLSEYRWCRDSLLKLRNYIQAIDDAITGEKPWPRRPHMPARPGSKKGPPSPRSAPK